MKLRSASIALPCLCIVAGAANANWVYDFASPPPGSFITTPLGPPSPTFSSGIAGGVLRLADPGTPAQGGAGSAAGFETSQSFGDVRVGALVNPTGTSDDLLNILARLDLS